MPSTAIAARMARCRCRRLESTLPPRPPTASAGGVRGAVMLAAGGPAEHVPKDRDGPAIIREREALDRRVVVARVAGAVRDHRAAPRGQQHVHVARAALLLV